LGAQATSGRWLFTGEEARRVKKIALPQVSAKLDVMTMTTVTAINGGSVFFFQAFKMESSSKHDECEVILASDGCTIAYNLWGESSAQDKVLVFLSGLFDQL
jgi:hypothetical protein